MKQFNFKKSFLTLVAMLFALVANATIADIQEAGYQPAGSAFGGANGESVAIDFEKEAIKAVVDLTGCQEHAEGTVETPETILSFGAKITAANYGMSGGVIHIFYYAGQKKLEVAWNSSSSTLYKGEQTLDDITNVTIELSKAKGLAINGKVWGADEKTDGTSESVAATPLLSDGNYGMSILNLTAIFVGSAYGEHSNATYTQLAVVDATTETPDVEEPKTFTVTSATEYVDEPFQLSNSYSYDVTPVDFANGDSIVVTLDLSTTTVPATADENVLTFGAKPFQWSGNLLHFYYLGTGTLRAQYVGGKDYRNDKTVEKGEITLSLAQGGLYLNGELWTGTSQNDKTLSQCDGTVLANLLVLNTITVGSWEHFYGTTVKSIKLYSTKEVTADTLSLPVADYTPSAEHGNMFTAPVDEIDFTKQAIKAVVDLTGCTEEGEEVITIGENTNKRDANWVRFTYKPSTKTLTAETRSLIDGTIYGGLGPVETVFEETPTELTLQLDSINGLLVNGTLLEGEDPYADGIGVSSTIKFSPENLGGILALKKAEVNSVYGEVRSHATYKSIEVVTLEQDPVVLTPDTIEIPLTEAYTPNEEHGNMFIGTTDVNFAEGDTLRAVVDLSTCTGQKELVLSIGDDISTWTNGNNTIHSVYVNITGFEQLMVCYNTIDGTQFNTTVNVPADKIVTYELTKDGLYVNGTLCSNATEGTSLDATMLEGLLASESLQVGSITTGETEDTYQHSHATYTTIEVAHKEEPKVVEKPEGIPFDLTAEGGWIANGDTFAWDSDIDWTKQALEIVVDLSNCTLANENTISLDASEADLAEWFASTAEGHIHFYYTHSTNGMEVNYLNTSSNLYRNTSYSLFTSTGDNTMVVSADGIKVNGTAWTGTSQYGSYTAFDATTIAPFTASDHVWVGSVQGDNRSYAIYKSIKLIDYEPVATGISSIDANCEGETTYNVYNLNGQMVKANTQNLTNLPKGLYIVNGKKMVLK